MLLIHGKPASFACGCYKDRRAVKRTRQRWFYHMALPFPITCPHPVSNTESWQWLGMTTAPSPRFPRIMWIAVSSGAGYNVTWLANFCNSIRPNESCHRPITPQPLVTVKPSKKGRSLLRCQERHVLRAWCVLLVSLIFCQQSLCVQWQESIGWWIDCWASFLLDVSQVVRHNDYGRAWYSDKHRGRTLLLGLIVLFLLYCLTYHPTPLSVLSYNLTTSYPYLVVHLSV